LRDAHPATCQALPGAAYRLIIKSAPAGGSIAREPAAASSSEVTV
jgi:hypothetical protein